MVRRDQLQMEELAQEESMGMTHRDVVGREVGGGFMFGNACKN